jgi:TetR/AcrR family transcriptional regulator, transcriptional repressor of aconitase
MPKVSPSHLAERRTQILEAAIACFSRQGFHRATMQDIVRQSKLSPGAIYNYFASKEEIIEAIAMERHAKEHELFAQAKREATLQKTLHHVRDFFFGQLSHAAERQRRRVTIQYWAESLRNTQILKLTRRGLTGPRTHLAAILRKAQRRGDISKQLDPKTTASFLIAAFQGLVLQAEWGEEINAGKINNLLGKFLSLEN